ncbi:hypothetical protein R83H12_01589 [Fibrobacteria bacterium R8-3-H12]
MKISWDIAKIKDVYGNEKTSQTKPFVIPGQDAAKADNKKVTWSIDAIKDVYVPETKKK